MRPCEECDCDLKGSYYTAKWEDDDNPYAYITCKNCGHKNYEYDDED